MQLIDGHVRENQVLIVRRSGQSEAILLGDGRDAAKLNRGHVTRRNIGGFKRDKHRLVAGLFVVNRVEANPTSESLVSPYRFLGSAETVYLAPNSAARPPQSAVHSDHRAWPTRVCT